MPSYQNKIQLKKKSKTARKIAILAFILLLATPLLWRFKTESNPSPEKLAKTILEQRTFLSQQLSHLFWQNHWPNQYTFNWEQKVDHYFIDYTLNKDLQDKANELLKAYKPDYGAIFLMDAQTGAVLAMSSYQRDHQEAPNLNLKASFPAASVFKVVTATAAVDQAGVSPYHKIYYNGGAYTLYRKNVLTEKVSRWTNVVTLKEAFARSLNTAFGRLSIEKLQPEVLYEYAHRFMFNQLIPTDFPVEMGVAYVPPEKGFELAEAASGFNRTNRMSPVQGAMIAAAVVNDGKLTIPYAVKQLQNSEQKNVYSAQILESGSIMTKESAEKIRVLMEQTVLSGTSRRSFRPIVNNKKFKEVEMGGKTGHLTGDNPKGRVDWFVGYAKHENHKLAIAAMTVNKKYWTVKSAHLAQSMFQDYFRLQFQENRKLATTGQ